MSRGLTSIESLSGRALASRIGRTVLTNRSISSFVDFASAALTATLDVTPVGACDVNVGPAVGEYSIAAAFPVNLPWIVEVVLGDQLDGRADGALQDIAIAVEVAIARSSARHPDMWVVRRCSRAARCRR